MTNEHHQEDRKLGRSLRYRHSVVRHHLFHLPNIMIPPLPAHISSNGQEIWDWAANASHVIHAQARIRELKKSVNEVGCGDCTLWMTKACPREKRDNVNGRPTGPSMSAEICNKFQEKGWVTELRNKENKEMQELIASIS